MPVYSESLLMPLSVHAVVLTPLPLKLWHSPALHRHYALSVMQQSSPSLDFDYLASLDFSVSLSFGSSLPANHHRISITGEDVSTIQRLVPAFSASTPKTVSPRCPKASAWTSPVSGLKACLHLCR